MVRIITSKLSLISFLLFLITCARFYITPKIKEEPLIRVLLFSEITDSLIITAPEGFQLGEIKMKKGERIILKPKVSPKWIFGKEKEIKITPLGKDYLRVGDLVLRGEVVLREEKGKIYILNILPLEEYLYSVVGCEIGPLNEKNFSAAKAQAVAARTYAIYRMFDNAGNFYHIYASPAKDQAYKGKNWETELTRRAVKETRGEVLTFKGRPIIAYYHANCGGLTNSKDKPYLKSLPDSPGHSPGRKPFCASSPHFSWELKIKKKELENIVKKEGIKKIFLKKDRKTKRVRRVEIKTKKGNLSLSGEEFRKLLELKSTFFDLRVIGKELIIKGRGWGHGWGMCQSGALEMARRGYSYTAILKHYYKGVKIEKIY
ncbi:MAG: SpoIID/LytB domain-containing protein [candidate division WOR-3 bacterium]